LIITMVWYELLCGMLRPCRCLFLWIGESDS